MGTRGASSRLIWTLAGVVALVAAWAGYQFLLPGDGARVADARTPVAAAASAPSAATRASSALPRLTDEQLERTIAQATAQSKSHPDDVGAWAMLAHSNEMLGRYSEATEAYAHLLALRPKDAQVMVDYADAMAVSHGRRLDGEPASLVARALALDPKNRHALALSAAAALEKADYPAAIKFLQRAREGATDPTEISQIDASLAQARALAAPGGASAALAAALPTQAAPAASGAASAAGNGSPARVGGRLWVADALKSKVDPQATVFIFARPADGSRMPVAIARRKASELPLKFTLDETMAMVKERTLASVPLVVVGARISARGDVTPHAGDLEGLSAPVPVGTTDLRLEIGEVRP